MVAAEVRKNRGKEKQFKKTKGKSTKLKGDRRGKKMRSHYCLVVKKEGKSNKSMVKHCWLYQSNCQVLRYCSHK